MKKFVSILTALCMAAGCSITASANELHDRYDEWRAAALDDGGMFRGFLSFNRLSPDTDYFLTPYSACNDGGPFAQNDAELHDLLPNGFGGTFTFCVPKNDEALIVLKAADCYDPAYDIFVKYFSFDETAATHSTGKLIPYEGQIENAYWIQNIGQDSSVWEDFSKALFEADLISEYYAPDHVWYEGMFLSVSYLTCYNGDNPYLDYDTPFDADTMQAYITANNLPCTLKTWKQPRSTETLYFVVPNEKVSAAEHMALAKQFYQDLGFVPYADPAPVSFFGKPGISALTHDEEFAALFPAAEPVDTSVGDLTLDGMVTVSDAVLMARLVAGDSTLEIADAARANADMNADGMFTADDLTMLLKQLVRE